MASTMFPAHVKDKNLFFSWLNIMSVYCDCSQSEFWCTAVWTQYDRREIILIIGMKPSNLIAKYTCINVVQISNNGATALTFTFKTMFYSVTQCWM